MATIEEMRARLKAKIAEQDAARGRPLTDAEKLANLAYALTHCDVCDGEIGPDADACPHCG